MRGVDEGTSAKCDLRNERQRKRREESKERREEREERREKRADGPQETASGSEMRPPEGDRPFPTPYRRKSEVDRRLESLHSKGAS